MPNVLIAVACFLFISAPIVAQKTTVKFGEISAEDFSPKYYSIDSNASAVVLSDVASSSYEGDTQGGFSIIFKRHTRIRIMDRKGFDAATLSIYLYASGSNEEKIDKLEANTYNLVNDKVEVTKLDKGSLFKDRLNKNFTVRKFTMPNLKEGCIIDISYKLISPYERDLRGWQFQGEYPVLYSEYQTKVPAVYDFAVFKQGYHPYKSETSKSESANYNILIPGETAADRSEVFSLRTTDFISTWSMENVPGLKNENYITTLDNYIAKLDFQLSQIKYPNTPVKNVLTNWMTVSQELLKNPNFGETLTKENNWLNDDLKKITGDTKGLEAATKVFAYLRDNFTCTNHSSKYLSNPLKKTFQTKSGNVADINLLLVAMLKQLDLQAHPVMLSTRDHGKVYEIYPMMDQLNYVICEVFIGDNRYLLDASHSRLGFGKLSTDCYNGYARVIAETPLLINLSADSLREDKLTFVSISNDDKDSLVGSYTSTLGYHQSYALREKINTIKENELFKEIKKSFSWEVDMLNTSIDSIKKYEYPVAIKYDFRFKPEEEMIYLNPIFNDAVKDNPFKAAERLYPVEMPYRVNETFVLRMDVPKGYVVEELPKSARVKFNEDEGMFEYLIDNRNGVIQLRTTIRLNTATFLPEDYQSLREFYAMVVKKHNEQIVLKKMN